MGLTADLTILGMALNKFKNVSKVQIHISPYLFVPPLEIACCSIFIPMIAKLASFIERNKVLLPTCRIPVHVLEQVLAG